MPLQLGEVAGTLVVPAGPVVDDHHLAVLLIHVEGDVRIVQHRTSQRQGFAFQLQASDRACGLARLRFVAEVVLELLVPVLGLDFLVEELADHAGLQQRVGRVLALGEGLHELGQPSQPRFLDLVEVLLLPCGGRLRE